jgi:hypothetical protein
MVEFYFCKAACNHTVEVQKIEVEDLNSDEV